VDPTLILRLCRRFRSPEGDPLLPGPRRHVAAAEELGEGRILDGLADFDVVVIDARGAGEEAESGLRDAIRRIRAWDGAPAALAVIDDDAVGLGPAAVGAGAWDVLFASELADQLADRLRAASRVSRLRRDASRASASDPAAPSSEAESSLSQEEETLEMVGTSDAIRAIFALIRRVAPFDVPVLLTGESGTGKELAALAIHERSPRAERPFVPINCGAIPEALLESELFGHEKGAFTGATHGRKGRFEAAEGGTIFLDEIGELAPSLQVKVLRFLQDHVVERVGGRSGVPLDVRVIAATNRDIQAMVGRGEFREDLYFRLAVLTIHMPPLRERGDDVVLMARYFLQRYAQEAKQPLRGYAREAIAALQQHAWPGNVRELINRVRRAVVVAEGALIQPGDLGLELPGAALALPSLREARRRAERQCLRDALERANGSKVEAARLLGISRTQLYDLIARYRIRKFEHSSD
jgi:DNA-binding NtrC family response regulator